MAATVSRGDMSRGISSCKKRPMNVAGGALDLLRQDGGQGRDTRHLERAGHGVVIRHRQRLDAAVLQQFDQAAGTEPAVGRRVGVGVKLQADAAVRCRHRGLARGPRVRGSETYPASGRLLLAQRLQPARAHDAVALDLALQHHDAVDERLGSRRAPGNVGHPRVPRGRRPAACCSCGRARRRWRTRPWRSPTWGRASGHRDA